MKIRIKSSAAGPDWVERPGDIIDVSPREAARRIERGSAEPYEERPLEVATAGQRSTATTRRRRRNKVGK